VKELIKKSRRLRKNVRKPQEGFFLTHSV